MFMPIGGAPIETFSTPLRATRVVAIMTYSLTVTDDSDEMSVKLNIVFIPIST